MRVRKTRDGSKDPELSRESQGGVVVRRWPDHGQVFIGLLDTSGAIWTLEGTDEEAEELAAAILRLVAHPSKAAGSASGSESGRARARGTRRER